jgi:CheY-like chemotaxis protein
MRLERWGEHWWNSGMALYSNALKSTPLIQESSSQSATVLVVEDDPVVREVLTCIVASLGVEAVSQARCGDEAISLLRRETSRFDTIFCDLQMPNGDGLDVVKACSSLGVSAKIVLMSGAGDNVLHAAAKRARADGHAVAATMSKPFSIEDVRAALCK